MSTSSRERHLEDKVNESTTWMLFVSSFLAAADLGRILKISYTLTKAFIRPTKLNSKQINLFSQVSRACVNSVTIFLIKGAKKNVFKERYTEGKI